jgi:hypothetical protein
MTIVKPFVGTDNEMIAHYSKYENKGIHLDEEDFKRKYTIKATMIAGGTPLSNTKILTENIEIMWAPAVQKVEIEWARYQYDNGVIKEGLMVFRSGNRNLRQFFGGYDADKGLYWEHEDEAKLGVGRCCIKIIGAEIKGQLMKVEMKKKSIFEVMEELKKM